VKVTPDVTRDVTHQLVEVCEPIHGPLVKWVVGAPLSRIEAFPVLAVDARTWRRSCGVGASGSPFRLAKDATGPRLTSTPPDWAAKQQTGTARTQFGEQSQLLIGGSRRRRGHEGFSDWGLGGGRSDRDARSLHGAALYTSICGAWRSGVVAAMVFEIG